MSSHAEAPGTPGAPRAWVEVDGGALRRNLRRVGEAVGSGVALVPMVKADAYGLGVARAVAALEAEAPWAFGVATVEEGVALRRLGVERPVLVFSPAPPESYDDAVRAGLTLALSELAALDRLAAAAEAADRRADFHVEIDTGMGRAGFDWRGVAEWGPRVAAHHGGRLRWSGAFTHLHSADQAGREASRVQWERFGDALAALDTPGDGFVVHVPNSAGALRFGGERPTGAARPGIFLYGGEAGEGLPAPEPVAALRARVLLVREVPAGTTLGYGATYRAAGAERWATLGIGYGDGLPRALGNRGRALLSGRSVPIVGRVSMDVTVANISEVGGVEVGDVATLIGRDGGLEITVDEVAELAGTISYEVLTGLTARLPRIWTDDGAS